MVIRIISILLVIQVLCCSVCVGKPDPIDKEFLKISQLKEILDPLDRDTQLIWRYSFISEELSRYQDNRSEAYLDTLRRLVELTDWDNGEGFYYRAMGRYHDFKGDFADALSYYDKAIQAYIPAGGDQKELAFTYVLKGFLLSNAEMYQECWKTLEEGLPFAKQATSMNSLCLMLDWFGDYYFYGLEDTTNNELAMEYYMQVNELLPQISYGRIIAGNHSGLSGIYYRNNEFKKSENHFRIADSICIADGLNHMRWGLHAEKARAFERKGEHEKANEIYRFVETFMKDTKNIEWKARLEKALWTNYKNLKNHEKALFHYERMVNMENQMSSDEVKKKYAEIEAKYELVSKETKISKLESNRQILIRNIALASLFIALGVGVFVYKRNKNLVRLNLELEKRQEEIKQAFYLGEKEERQRLAGELHDNVNTKLAAARWQLEAITADVDNKKHKSIVDKTIVMMNEAYQDVRNISHNLLPAQLESEGLISSINELISNLNSGGNIELKFDHDSFVEMKVKNIIYPVYNIIYELINNIMKHSAAKDARIELLTSEEELLVNVSDNGKGFEVNNNKIGFGLRSIKNRVESLHGKIAITSAIQKGTQTMITIPI